MDINNGQEFLANKDKPNLRILCNVQFNNDPYNILDLSSYGHIGTWDMSNCSDMDKMFKNCKNIPPEIGHWDTSNVIYMNETFKNSRNIPPEIGNWNMRNVDTLYGAFSGATGIPDTLEKWDLRDCDDVRKIFKDAKPQKLRVGRITRR